MPRTIHGFENLCALAPLSLVLLLASCSGNLTDENQGDDVTVLPDGAIVDPNNDGGLPQDRPEPSQCDSFEPITPATYGTKIKSLLTGNALSDAELATLEADPEALRGLISGWLAQPEADQKLLRFFVNAFQQTGFTADQWADQYAVGTLQMGRFEDGRNVEDLFMRNLEESFARTMLHNMREGRPFNEAATTQTFMMTTAMVFALAFQDDRVVNDERKVRYRAYGQQVERLVLVKGGNIPLANSTTPGHADFMRFSVAQMPECAPDEFELAGDRNVRFFRLAMGFLETNNQGSCTGQTRVSPLLGEDILSDWRMVTVRKPSSSEPSSNFLNLSQLKDANELVLHTPRVGYFTTPAFFSVWQTNDANQSRVTMNQTLITSFGKSFDGNDITVAALEDALDESHADPGTTCYGCHQTLDPMRQFFRHDYSIYYGQQQSAEQRAIPTEFAFGGVNETGGDIYDLGRIIAEHPLFAPAWVQKLCYFANAGSCPEDNDTFDSVVRAFEQSDFDLTTAIVSLFSSPLITGAHCVEGSTADLPGIARQDHFCASISARTGVADACGLDEIRNQDRTGLQRDLNAVIGIIPADGFSRGSEEPIVLSDPNMFMSAASEYGCERVASRLVASDGVYQPGDDAQTVRTWVSTIMGLPQNDERHEPIYEVLMDHLQEASDGGASALNALRSTFILACDAPTSTGVGL